MMRIGVLLAAAFLVCVRVDAAGAACFPVKSDVVSIGQKSANAYAERSLDKSIEDEKQRLISTGAEVGPVMKKELNCKPFPNLIGADEWRCLGEARVCSKTQDQGKPERRSRR